MLSRVIIPLGRVIFAKTRLPTFFQMAWAAQFFFCLAHNDATVNRLTTSARNLACPHDWMSHFVTSQFFTKQRPSAIVANQVITLATMIHVGKAHLDVHTTKAKLKVTQIPQEDIL